MKLNAPAAPNLPNGPMGYERQYQEQLNNVLRLYFNQMSSTLQAVVGNEGGQYLSFPYGSFFDATTQTAASANTAYAVTFDHTDTTNSVRLGSPTSRIIVDEEGIYNFAFSLQLAKSTSSTGYAYIWYRVNGINIDNTTTKVLLNGSNAAAVAAWNFFVSLNSGDYFELMWAADNTHTTILQEAATAFCPAIPSAILTVNFVSIPPQNASV